RAFDKRGCLFSTEPVKHCHKCFHVLSVLFEERGEAVTLKNQVHCVNCEKAFFFWRNFPLLNRSFLAAIVTSLHPHPEALRSFFGCSQIRAMAHGNEWIA